MALVAACRGRIEFDAVDWHDRIEVDPEILVGRPVIKGTRLAVELIVERMAGGWSVGDVLAAYPHLAREDVLATLAFAAELLLEEDYAAACKAGS